jgi:hypothetical protein
MTGIRTNQVPWGVLGAFIAVLAIESVIERHDLALTRPECINWRSSRRAAVKKARGCEVLCLGTSMTQEGVFPQVIERETGKRAYNLAVCGGRVEYDYYYLRQALAAGARPSALVVDFHPAFLTSSYRSGAGYTDAMGFWDCLEMAWTVGDPDLFATTTLARILPTDYHRDEIRNFVLGSFRGQPASMLMTNLQYIRNMNWNRGALVNLRNPNYHGEVSDVYKGYFLGDGPWRCDPIEEVYLHKFLGLAAAHGIRVYWLVMPLAPALQSGRDAKGLDEEYTRFVRSFRKYSNLVVLDGRHSGYDAGVFMDACHLDPQGAYVFSRGVAEVLRRHDGGKAAGERWVALPAYEEHPIDVPLEDLKQSGLALQSGEAFRRGPKAATSRY